jgi:hypothetical protein
MNLDEAIARTKEASESQRLGELGRETALQLAAWLEELKQYREQHKEQNQETNLDHFQQEILEKGLWNLAVVKGRPERCDHTKCIDCELSKDRSRGCHEKVMNWLKQPRKAPAIKLTKFEVDLLQSYLKSSLLSGYEFKSIAILKRMKGKGYFKDVDEDATIEDILADCDITEED